ncbi:MAG: class I SAM-dependent methyltransferase [Planctomycetota bacterium]
MLEYDSINNAVLRLAPTTVKHVLDLGCGCGSLGAALKGGSSNPPRITGVTFNEREAAMARSVLDEVVVADLNQLNPEQIGGPFDCLICSHVLEHLYRPDLVLANLRPFLTPDAVVLVALPNTLAWRQRFQFLVGRFRYTDGGLMDRTHYRFFDWVTARQLLTMNGYRVEKAEADGVFPGARWLPVIGPMLSRVAVRMAPGLFAWQFVIRARPVSV